MDHANGRMHGSMVWKMHFSSLQGVPPEILFDNAKTIMIERDAYQEG